MINENNISDWIEKYLDSELTPDQETLLVKELEQNTNWSEAFKQEQLLRKAINVYNVNRIQKQVRQDLSSGKAYESNKFSGKLWMIILCITGLALYVGWKIYSSEGSQSNQREIKVKLDKKLVDKEDFSMSQIYQNESQSVSSPASVQDKHESNGNINEVFGTTSIDSLTLLGEDKLHSDNLIVTDSVRIPVMINKNEHRMTYAKDICEGVLISFEYKTVDPCKGKDEGQILISGFKGGQRPYNQVVLDQHEKQVMPAFLAAGVYMVLVKDNNGCEASKLIQIRDKECEKVLELLFRPDFETQIRIPVVEKEGALKIFSPANEEIWSSELQGGNEFVEWTGIDKHGNKVSRGVYAILIRYEDGMVTNGYITVY